MNIETITFVTMIPKSRISSYNPDHPLASPHYVRLSGITVNVGACVCVEGGGGQERGGGGGREHFSFQLMLNSIFFVLFKEDGAIEVQLEKGVGGGE